jgi:PAS domain-containing protein
MVAALVAIEGAIMVGFHLLIRMPALQEGVADTVLLSLVFLPVLYYNSFRPLMRQISRHERAEAGLEEARANLRSLVDKNPTGMLVVDIEGIVRFANPAAQSFLNRNPDELIGGLLGFPLPTGQPTEVDIIRGAERGVAEVQVDSTEWLNASTHLVTLRDITERKQAEEALTREVATTRLLQGVIRAANEAPTVEAALQAVLDMVCETIGWPIGHVYLVMGDSTPEIVPSNVWHDLACNFAINSGTLRFSREQELPGQVLARREPVWIPDLAQWPGFLRAEAAAEAGLRSAFAVPIMASSQVVGVLEFFSTEPAAQDANVLEPVT